MPPRYHDAVRDPDAERDLGVVYRDRDTVLREAAFVTLHVPLLPETHHYIDERALRLMKPTAYLVNAAWGAGDPRGGARPGAPRGLDRRGGPRCLRGRAPGASGALECPNAVLASHIASASRETRLRMATMAVEDALAILEGRRPAIP